MSQVSKAITLTSFTLEEIDELTIEELDAAIDTAMTRLERLMALREAVAVNDRRRIERLVREYRRSKVTPHWDGEYESPGGDPIPFYRCDGALICWDCWKPYRDHPEEPREPCLTVLCNGWHVKL